ncbi:DUF4198 domain-containing protein [Bordetella genomosp. 12]|uniref:ABC transporter permease n=1 Tax=Bordetella genomosp. 12 TaxID=463035 RepID=A0A261VAI9_9BORD|nr:DUF4198 domain-containing protein [Bordetella genomosp. 12]OZI71168.1 ABC transporter permease [Bordetella genomosp. 12]
MKLFAKLSLAAALILPLGAHAHDMWLLPSSTVLSGANGWVTVDAAVSNDKFYANHAPLRLDNLVIIAPDGSQVQAENAHRGKLRSTFDLPLAQAGTYRLAVVNDGVFARWKEDGKPKRYFGKAEGLAEAVPAKAQDLEITQALGRVETFVTSGKPSPLKPVGRGLEMVAVSHPNDLYSDEAATFQMMVDGKPAAGLEVTVVPDGGRYRDKVEEITLKTDAQGKFQIKWPRPGMYWVEARQEDKHVSVPKATMRRLTYAGTLEVLRP